MTVLFKYEKCVKIIYAVDIWTYHLVTYVIYDHAWDKLPSFTWLSPFWGLALLSWLLWVCMVFLKRESWNQSPTDSELKLWFVACFFVQPIFLYKLASFSEKWFWFIGMAVYRGWSFRQMMMLIQEVREKTFLLQIGGGRERQ